MVFKLNGSCASDFTPSNDPVVVICEDSYYVPNDEGNYTDVIDGKHRLARAYQQGERTVRVREVCMKKAPRNMRILFLQKNYERSN